MKDIHLTAEDFQKYMDTSDLSETYLVWVEKINAHLYQCDKCQQVLQKLQLLDSICQEENFGAVLALAAQEEDVRRGLLICKLQQMQEQARMAEVIRMLQSNAVVPITLQASALQRSTGVSRGKENAEESQALGCGDTKRIETFWKEGILTVKVAEPEEKQSVSVVVDREAREPIVCEAKWNALHKQWIAEIALDSEAQIEVYIL